MPNTYSQRWSFGVAGHYQTHIHIYSLRITLVLRRSRTFAISTASLESEFETIPVYAILRYIIAFYWLLPCHCASDFPSFLLSPCYCRRGYINCLLTACALSLLPQHCAKKLDHNNDFVTAPSLQTICSYIVLHLLSNHYHSQRFAQSSQELAPLHYAFSSYQQRPKHQTTDNSHDSSRQNGQLHCLHHSARRPHHLFHRQPPWCPRLHFMESEAPRRSYPDSL